VENPKKICEKRRQISGSKSKAAGRKRGVERVPGREKGLESEKNSSGKIHKRTLVRTEGKKSTALRTIGGKKKPAGKRSVK